ncbi:DUF3600 domain-containing protein [Aneurinibacillus terranovensis]|uniref:DUF3600 domain-containing protein n=1 Tax=Aneurinibacillus terranovensis TaxID=278991 RepID=UPI0004096F87|nr:DUF3600 domain-containing protein [Aneurinibacillus terranovensis]
MDIEKRIMSALQEEAINIVPAPELREKVMASIPFEKGRKQVKKRLVAGIVAAAVLVPTAAYGSYSYLADQVFGSSNVVKEHGGTQQQYDHFESKLQQAKKKLTAKEFITFVGLLKDLAYYHLKTIDSHGNIHPDRLQKKDRADYDRLLQEVQPYFDKLNGDIQTK